MNEKIITTLEFDKIQQRLGEYAITEKGRQKAAALCPATDYETVKKQIDQTDNLLDIVRVFGGLPIVNYRDLAPVAKRLRIDADLNQDELANILLFLGVTNDVQNFLATQDRLDLTAITEFADNLQVPAELYKRLKQSLELDGTILDTASPELKRIRQSISATEAAIKKTMDQYLHGNLSKYLSEQIITIRDNRYVVPVKQEARGKFGGIVHDESASGQTLFIEPQGVVNQNNNLQELHAAEKTEIRQILFELSNLTRTHLSEILASDKAISELDFIQSKAKLAQEMQATKPAVNRERHINLLNARHPLIDPAKVVANDLQLGLDYDTMLITGPNTGGKTITLKTLGLAQLMAQSGLFVAADFESEVGVFTEVFADIGDEQSIEQNLSTFSSHMDNIIKIMAVADENSLVLVDELGSGTDPEEGAALAIAILDQLKRQHSLIAATTHYPELKLYGYNSERTINASMEFDTKTLSPTYHLLLGVPGFSNAFLITKRLGMKPEVITQAQSLISDDDNDLNKMIAKLTEQTKQATKTRQEFQEKLKVATQTKETLEQALDYYRQQEEKQLNHARQKADEIIAKAQRQSAKIIAELEEAQKNGQQQVKADKLIAAKGDLNRLREDNLAHNRVLKRAKKKNQLKVGDQVKVLNYEQFGQITKQITPEEFEVQMGIIKVRAKAIELEKVTQAPAKKKKPQRKVSHTAPLRRSGTSSTLDLRGQRYEEAMENLDRYLDSILLAGIDSATIIHGIGTGAIRTGVQEYLRSNRRVKSFAYAPEGSGGSGATIIELQ